MCTQSCLGERYRDRQMKCACGRESKFILTCRQCTKGLSCLFLADCSITLLLPESLHELSDLDLSTGRLYLILKFQNRFSSMYDRMQGPVLVSMLFGLADVFMNVTKSNCVWWVLSGCFGLASTCAIVCWGIFRIRTFIKSGDMSWVSSRPSSFQVLRADLKVRSTAKEKAFTLFLWWYQLRFKGDWKKDSVLAKWWGFLVANVTDSLWVYFAVRLVFKFYTAAVVNLLPGPVGSAMLSGFLFFEMIIIVINQPHRDNWQNRVHPITFLLNFLCSLGIFISVVLPTIPNAVIPEWLLGPLLMFMLVAATSLQLCLSLVETFSVGICALLGPTSAPAKSFAGFMWARFERIGLTRSSKRVNASLANTRSVSNASMVILTGKIDEDKKNKEMEANEKDIEANEIKGVTGSKRDQIRAEARCDAPYGMSNSARIVEASVHQEPTDAILFGGLFASTGVRRLQGNDIILTPQLKILRKALSPSCDTSEAREANDQDTDAGPTRPDKARLLEVVRNLNNSGVVTTAGEDAGGDAVQQLTWPGLPSLSSLWEPFAKTADADRTLGFPMSTLPQFAAGQMHERLELPHISTVPIPPRLETPKGGLP